MSPDQQRRPVPDLVTMPLLDRLVAQSLDQDYEHVARRTAESRAETATAAGPPRRTARRSPRRPTTAVAALAAFGLLVAVAAVQTWRDAPSTANDRAALVTQIGRENAAAAAQQRSLRRLRTQTTALQRSLRSLDQQETAAQARLRRVAARTGYRAVSGPGVRAVADNAAVDGDGDGRIRDEDLAMLVDGLWGAGARAVVVNGIRLTALSPIRTSGLAIHVAFRPISPPYTVLALGDTATLQARFADTTHGLAWLSLVSTFGFRFEMQNEDDVRLPAASGPVLRSIAAAPPDATSRKDAPS